MSDFMAKLRRGSGLDSYGNAYQFPYEKQAVAEFEKMRDEIEQLRADRVFDAVAAKRADAIEKHRDELAAEVERAWQHIECMGVTRERGKTLPGALSVLDSRLSKEARIQDAVAAEIEQLRKERDDNRALRSAIKSMRFEAKRFTSFVSLCDDALDESETTKGGEQ